MINTITQTHLPEEQIWAEWKPTQKETLLRAQTSVCLPFVHTSKSPCGAYEEGHSKSHIENYQSFQLLQHNVLPTQLPEAKLADLWGRTFPLQGQWHSPGKGAASSYRNGTRGPSHWATLRFCPDQMTTNDRCWEGGMMGGQQKYWLQN